MVQVLVPEGEFLMGAVASDLAANDDEKPQHTVYLDGFWIDQTEVTNAMYALCVKDGWCQSPADPRYFNDPQLANYPVVNISGASAERYCRWVNGRLPTEAEWEKAARGTDGNTYPWGNTLPDGNLLNFCDRNCLAADRDNSSDDGYAETAPVGSYPAGASPYGVLDMAGNVWEWVADWYSASYYAVSESSNPLGPEWGDSRVVRGSNWYSTIQDLRLTIRYYERFGRYTDRLGFRCVR